MNHRNAWSADSWRSYPIKQQPKYSDLNELRNVEAQISQLPSMVNPDEIDQLKIALSQAEKGGGFLLQCGDCAESFHEFNELNLRNYFQTMLQMTVALMYGAKKPVVKIGRIAGQFTKPRSQSHEIVDGVELEIYRGDMVNSMSPSKHDRAADPKRLIRGYYQSAATLNYLRSLSVGSFPSLENIMSWNQEFISSNSDVKVQFQEIVKNVDDCISFIKSCSNDKNWMKPINEATFYISHEGLLLNYEQALTRKNRSNGKYYCLSGHMLWIGDRTKSLNEAHVEFMRGIENPIGIKVGPSTNKEELLEVVKCINPKNESGKIVLISRMGSEILSKLPDVIDTISSNKLNVLWSCDPMHGNTIKSKNGYKTRKFDDILKEIITFFSIHRSKKTIAGGIHLEMTGQNVTECLGGSNEIIEEDLQNRYHTHCDPRLNASQSLELAFILAKELSKC